jgi:glycosyltransferase 2 family protein
MRVGAILSRIHMSKIARFACLLLRWVTCLVLVAWAVWRVWSIRSSEDEQIGLQVAFQRPVQIWPLVLGCLVTLAAILLTIVRWLVLVRAQLIPLGWSRAIRIGLRGYYFNTFLPGAVGGDLVKVIDVDSDTSRRIAVFASVTVDRVLGLCGLLWLVAMTGAASWSLGFGICFLPSECANYLHTTILVAATCLAIGSLSFWILFTAFGGPWTKQFGQKLENGTRVGWCLAGLWRAMCLYRDSNRSLGLALGLSFIVHSGSILAFYCAARSVCPTDGIPTLGAHFLLVPVGMIIRAGFPTPGGIGAAEITFGELYSALGAPFGSGVLASLVTRSFSWIVGALGYLVVSRMPTQ